MRTRGFVLFLAALVLPGLTIFAGASPAVAERPSYGPGYSGWVNYYSNPSNTSTWSPFCAGGGGSPLTVPTLAVPACGPTGGTGIDIPLAYPYTSGGETYTPGFQCVELADRYLYVTQHWGAIDGNGATVARIYGAAHSMSPVHNGTAGDPPAVGDVISFSVESNFTDDGGYYPGHVAVVSASNVNSSGNGTIHILSENWAEGAADTELSVSGWRVQPITTGDSSGGYVSTPYIEWLPLKGGSTPPPPSGFGVAFQANTGHLWTYMSSGGGKDLDQGMKAGTSPAIAAVPGGYEEAFQANTGALVVVGTVLQKNTGLGMKAGTSPAIASLSGGSFEVAFQANTGVLWLYSSKSGSTNTGDPMMAGTSPAVAGLAGGGFEVAYQASNGNLNLYSSSSGHKALGLGMYKGTSPAIAGLSDGSYEIAFEANTGDLYLHSPTSQGQLGLGMYKGTSPAIAAVGDSYEVAFEANTGDLYVHSPTSQKQLGLGMYLGTSPAVTAVGESYEVAFEANTTSLYLYSPSGGAKDLKLGMDKGTDPAIA